MVRSPFPSQYILIHRRVNDSVHWLPALHSQMGGLLDRAVKLRARSTPTTKIPRLSAVWGKPFDPKARGAYLHRSPQRRKTIPLSQRVHAGVIWTSQVDLRPVL